MKSCTQGNIKRTVLSHFTRDTISDSKKLLWKECASGHNIDYHTRKDTKARSQAEANVCDILEALSEMDRKTDGRLPVVFAAADLSLLPRHTPEEINPVALIQRIQNLENIIDGVNNTLSTQAIHVTSIDEKIKSHDDLIATHGVLIESVSKRMDTESTESTESKPVPPVRGDPADYSSSSAYSDSETEDEDEPVTAAPSRPITPREQSPPVRARHHSLPVSNRFNTLSNPTNKVPKRHDILQSKDKRGKSGGNATQPKRSFAKVAGFTAKSNTPQFRAPAGFAANPRKQSRAQQVAPSNQTNAQQSDGFTRDGFTKQRHQRRREQKTDNKMTGDKKIFVYNVPVHNTVSEVKDYLKDAKIYFIDVSQVSHPDARRKSFSITVKQQYCKNMLNEHFWPNGVRCRSFQDRRN